MKVRLCHHIAHPFSQGKVHLSKKEKFYSRLGLILLPLLFIPGLIAFYTTSFCYKKRALKNYSVPKKNVAKPDKFVFSLDKTDSLFKKQKSKSKTDESNKLPKSSTSEKFEKKDTKLFVSVSTSTSYALDQTSTSETLSSSVESDNQVNLDSFGSWFRTPASLNKASRLVLKTSGFETPSGIIPKYHDPIGQKDSVEEIQGTPELRKAARFACNHYVHALSPSALKENKDANNHQYFLLKVKRISHVFGLKGRINLPSGLNINLEGFCEDFTIPMIASSFAEFYKANSSTYTWLSSKAAQRLQKNLLGLLTTDTIDDKKLEHLVVKLQDKNFKGLIAGGSGFDWHSTISGFIGDAAFICNRGAYSMTSGIALYSNPDKNFITTEVLRDLSTRQNHDKNTFFGHKAMVGELGATQTTIIKMDPQEAGNCTYRSIEAYLYLLMVFAYMKSMDPTNFLENLKDPKKLEKAFAAVLPVFNAWLNFDRWLVSHDLIEDIAIMEANMESGKEYKLLKELEYLMIHSKVYHKLNAS